MQLPEGDPGTGVTIQHMIGLIEAGKKNPLVNRAAASIVRSVPQFQRLAEASAVYQWVRRNIRFTSDVKGVETLRAPAETLTAGVGDCDDYVTLIASLLATIGHNLRIVTVASDPRDPSIFTHVFPEDYIRGRWVALDAARRNPAIGKRPSRVYRVRVWQMDGTYFDLDPRDYAGGADAAEGGDERAMHGLGFLAQDDTTQILNALTPDITAATTGAANIIRAVNSPTYPYGTVTVPAQTYYSSTTISSYMPLLLIGGAVAVFLALRK